MKKTILIILGSIKIVLGSVLLGVGAGHGAIVIILGIVWIIVAVTQKQFTPNGNKRIDEVVHENYGKVRKVSDDDEIY